MTGQRKEELAGGVFIRLSKRSTQIVVRSHSAGEAFCRARRCGASIRQGWVRE
jgi:hypothetical protein